MSRIAIVTDSTCDMGPGALAAIGVEMVSLKIQFGSETYLDWIDLSTGEFYAKMASAPRLPTTSQPSPADFSQVYDRLAEEGALGIVSIHLSSHLSGTYDSALLASKDATIPVRVIDSAMASWAVALVVQAAAAARDAGGDIEAVERAAQDAAGKTNLYFVLDTLDNLVKGGRAGKAQGLAAALLNIKPILMLEEGEVVPFKKVRGAAAAYQQLAAHVAEMSRQLGGVKAVVIHAVSCELAEKLADQLRAAGLVGEIAGLGDIGAVIGTYAGPRAVGVAFLPLA